MKILTLIDVFSFKPAGGAGTVMFSMARELVRKGHEVHVICRRRTDLPVDGAVDGVQFHTFDLKKKGGIGAFFEAIGKTRERCLRLSDEVKFDVIHAHHPLPAYAIKGETWAEKIPVFLHFHSPWHEEHQTRKLTGGSGMFGWIGAWARRRVESVAVDMAAGIIVLSRYMKKKVIDIHEAPEGKITVIPGGADTKVFIPTKDKAGVRRSLGLPEGAFIIHTVRSLIPRTGVDKLMEAFALAKKDIPDAHLVISGIGPMEAELKTRAESLGISGAVTFTGFVANELLAPYYQAADLEAMPSQDLEGFGLVTVEAMACGTPVIATPIGGNVEILAGFEPEMISNDKGPEALAETMKLWSAKRKELQALSIKSREFVERNYTWEIAADALLRAIPSIKRG